MKKMCLVLFLVCLVSSVALAQEKKRSVEVRQTFSSAQHSRRRQAGSRLYDRTDQLHGY